MIDSRPSRGDWRTLGKPLGRAAVSSLFFGLRSDPHQPANQYLLRSVSLLFRGDGSDPAV